MGCAFNLKTSFLIENKD